MDQRAHLIVAIVCVPSGPRRSLVSYDCRTPAAVVSIFTDSAACVVLLPLHTITLLLLLLLLLFIYLFI